jgi:predicted NodU family carbamoyl transferase
MPERKDPSLKVLTPKQLDRLKAGYRLEGGEIPPWYKATNKNTNTDLKRFNVYQIQEALEQALLTGKHREQLEAIRDLANRGEVALNVVFNATKRDPKHRERVEALISDLELAVSRLDNETGFDLLSKETWKEGEND